MTLPREIVPCTDYFPDLYREERCWGCGHPEDAHPERKPPATDADNRPRRRPPGK